MGCIQVLNLATIPEPTGGAPVGTRGGACAPKDSGDCAGWVDLLFAWFYGGGVMKTPGSDSRVPIAISQIRSRRFGGGQKLLVVVAFIVAVLIVSSPEFAAFGLLGDAAFFDALVLLLGLQFRMIFARAWGWVRVWCSILTMGLFPRLSFQFSLVVLAFAVPLASAVAAIQKVVQRLSS